MIPGGIDIGFMVSHTVDGHLLHHVVLRVILVGFGVQIAVATTSGEVLTLIAHGEIHAIGLGIFHILILTHTDGVVFRNQFARSLLGRYGHQRDHAVHLINIRRQGQRQVPDGIFHAGTEIIRGLCLQVFIAQVEIHTIHILDILIVQLLRRRCLVTLTPGGSQSQVAQLQHG